MIRILDPHEIGRRIREVRTAAGLTQTQLAGALGGRSANFMSRLEQGTSKTIDYERLIRIANETAGRWMLRDTEPEQVLDYLEGRSNLVGATIGSKRGDRAAS